MIPIYIYICVISHNTHEIWSSFEIWTWISGFSFFWRHVVEIVAWSRLPLCTQRWITAVLLAKFRPSWWEHKFNLYVFNVHLCWFELLTASNRYKLWIWRSFVPGDGPPVVCARGRPQLDASGENTAPELWCFVSLGIDWCVHCSSPRDIRTRDFKIPGCRDGTWTSTNRVPARFEYFDSCHSPDLYVLVKNCL